MRAPFSSRSFGWCVTILLLGVAACEPATTALTPAGERVRLSKIDAPASCREVGPVESSEADFETAKFKLRNAGAERGANYVRWDSAKGNYLLTGTAFQCPADALD